MLLTGSEKSAILVRACRALATAGCFTLVGGCVEPGHDDEWSDSQGDQAWFQVGWGVTEFNALERGDDLEVVWGPQGAAMFPLPLRGGGFVLPDPPSEYNSPLAPKFSLEIDVSGHNDRWSGGHFISLADGPIPFEIQPDGSYEFLFVAAVLPDGVDPATLEGLATNLWAQLRPYESEPMELELDMFVRAGSR